MCRGSARTAIAEPRHEVRLPTTSRSGDGLAQPPVIAAERLEQAEQALPLGLGQRSPSNQRGAFPFGIMEARVRRLITLTRDRPPPFLKLSGGLRVRQIQKPLNGLHALRQQHDHRAFG